MTRINREWLQIVFASWGWFNPRSFTQLVASRCTEPGNMQSTYYSMTVTWDARTMAAALAGIVVGGVAQLVHAALLSQHWNTCEAMKRASLEA